MSARALPRMQTDRMKALTDGVFAIVLTILVLTFEVPDHDFSQHGLLVFLQRLVVPFVAYTVTFGIVASYWIVQASIFHYVTTGNRAFFWLNLLFLLPVTILPFLTSLRATYHSVHVVTALYAATNVICGLLLLVIWKYGTRRQLMPRVSGEVDRSMRRRIQAGIALNIVGAAAAWIDPHLSSAFFIALPLLFVSHRVVDSHWDDPEL
jgi:uncharacterized membrane protein